MDNEKNTDRSYVPKKIQTMAQTLIKTQDLDACMQKLRDMYPNLYTLRSSLCKLKTAVIDTNVRHPDYPEAMATWETVIQEYILEQQAVPQSLLRLKDFNHFRQCSLKRQLHIQKKIQLGQANDFFSHKDDMDHVLRLKLAPDYFHKIHLDIEETKKVQEQQAHKMKCLSNTVVRIANADEVVANARRVLKNPDNEPLCAVATALALTTGRRMVEIFQRGEFVPEAQHRRYSLLFTGQAKTGLQEMVGITTNKPMEYSIPLLAPASNVIQAVSVLRNKSQTVTMAYKQINSIWCRKLNAYVKKNIHSELGFHDLRTLYALISYEVFKPHTYSINGWICNTLGHSGLNMSVSYTRMQVYGLGKLHRHNREAPEDFLLG